MAGFSLRGAVVFLTGALLLFAAVAFGPIAPPRFDGARVVRSRAIAPRAEVTELPLAAQAPVSRILGRNDPSYRAARRGRGFVLRNRRQHLRVWFDRRGVVIRSGRASLGLSMSGWGYGDRLQAVGSARPRVQANRVVYQRGAFAEWYADGPLGLEQGFTFAVRPRGPHGGPLTLSLAPSGNVRSSLSLGADAVTFTRAGVALAYRGLIATDARGRLLPARIELRHGRLLLRIDDRLAQYPLRVDPLVQQAKLTALDGDFREALGGSVAVSGDTIVVGADQAGVFGVDVKGAAYVFVKPAGGWASETEAAKLTASDGRNGDHLGLSVGVSGDTVVAGTRDATVNGHVSQGAVYVFVKPAGGWASETETAKLTASDGGVLDNLGESVAVCGDTVVAGAGGATVNGQSSRGAIYVFVKPAGGWTSETEAAKLSASDGFASPQFAQSVAISGNIVVGGAVVATVNGHQDQGAAYVFEKPEGGWASETETAKLTASDGAADDQLGTSVAVSRNTVVAGAPNAMGSGRSGPGAAYVFVEPVRGWASETETAKLTASDSAAGDEFGFSVAVSGRTVVSGAWNASVSGHVGQGVAYVFVEPARGWASETETAKLTASDGAVEDEFGVSVTVSGSTIVAGAPAASVNGNFAGAAYVFLGPDPTTTSVACSPRAFAPGDEAVCTATITDTTSSGHRTPTGTVTFANSGTGSFLGSPCVLSGSGDSASCAVFFTSFARGGQGITASYGGDALHDASAGSTIVFVALPASTNGCVEFGHGRIAAANGDRASFRALVRANPPTGAEFYRDNGPADAFRLMSTSVDALTCSADSSTASAFGSAKVNGSGSVQYRVDVQLAAWKGGKDTYRIRLSSGYDSGTQEIRHGHMEVLFLGSTHHHRDTHADHYKPGAPPDGG